MGGNKEGEGPRQGLIPETGWQQEGLSHEDLVDEFQRFIREEEKHSSATLSPAEIVRLRLEQGWRWHSGNNNPLVRERRDFFFTLANAWDALAYDRYKPGSLWEHFAGAGLEALFVEEHVSAIKLSHSQIRIIDALTEATGIKHKRGQAEIPIPEKLKNYSEYQLSPEYQARKAKVREQDTD